MEKTKTNHADLSGLIDQLPPIIARNQVSKFLGGLISTGYLQNLDWLGIGPRRIRCGKKIGYLREDLIRFLESRSTIIEPGPSEPVEE